MNRAIQLKAAAEHTESPAIKHQGEAWDWLQQQLSIEIVAEFARRYRTGPAGGEIALAVELNKLYEGLHLEAYPDPLSGGVPWTIGWGSTRWYDGEAVKKGQSITRELADEMLQGRVEADARVMATRVPGWDRLMMGQRAALLSFSYNLGVMWFGTKGFATLTECFRSGRLADVPATLMLYRNPGTNVELGLGRRRRAEGLVWGGVAPAAAKAQATGEIPRLPIPAFGVPGAPVKPMPVPAASTMRRITYFSQRDSRIPGASDRMCFSSSAAMFANYFLPGAFALPNGDDDYFQRLTKNGGETGHAVDQVAFLRALGVPCEFTKQGNWALLEREITAGRPVLVGWLHNGPYNSPLRDHGHWSMVGGIDATHVTMYDPAGEADMIQGGYLAGTSGSGVRYTRKRWGGRWMADGAGSGWAVVAS